MSKIEQTRNWVYLHAVTKKKSELTPKQIATVPCPTCGVAIGKRCVLHSGAQRSEPHVDRKLSALETIERKSGSLPTATHLITRK